MFLFIDTCQKEKMEIVLLNFDCEIIDDQALKIERDHSEKLLPLIERFLKKNQTELERIKAIGVASGPGSFTGVRVGVATANALAYSLDIPVLSLKRKAGSKLVKRVFQNLNKHGFLKSAIPYYLHNPV